MRTQSTAPPYSSTARTSNQKHHPIPKRGCHPATSFSFIAHPFSYFCCVTRGSTLILIVYAMTMLSYGALEMGHDLLHYLDAHSHIHVHHHDHGHDHSFDDHHHHSHNEVHSHTHTAEPVAAELPSLVSLFLYTQSITDILFIRQLLNRIPPSRTNVPLSSYRSPVTPPPRINRTSINI
jgi:hypothetical protein